MLTVQCIDGICIIWSFPVMYVCKCVFTPFLFLFFFERKNLLILFIIFHPTYCISLIMQYYLHPMSPDPAWGSDLEKSSFEGVKLYNGAYLLKVWAKVSFRVTIN